eukprot:XP_001709781.1 Hypothetical protein GL50803_34325 [Giardia lamblia ATCC 50803]
MGDRVLVALARKGGCGVLHTRPAPCLGRPVAGSPVLHALGVHARAVQHHKAVLTLAQVLSITV